MEHQSVSSPDAVALPSAAAVEKAHFFHRPRWEGRDGVRNLIVIAVPLIITNAVHAVNMFLDRIFLAWHSAEAFAAALQAGTLYWAFVVIFFQTCVYGGTLAAQYLGAGKEHRVGPVVWQAVYLGIIGGILAMALGPLARPFLNWIGHQGNLPALEYEYFSIMTFCSVPLFMNAGLHGFFAAQGRTWTIFFVNACQCILNACLNSWMIFEPIGPFPDGIGGAAWATVFGNILGTVVFLLLMVANRQNETRFRALSGWRYDRDLLRRLLRYGFPSGVHGLIDMVGFTTFLFVVGLFGMQAQFASNMAMNLNLLLFIPAVGVHMAVNILSGQMCGARDHRGVERMTASAALLLITYMALVCFFFIGIPEPLLAMFRGGMPEHEWQAMLGLAKILLYFAAAYTTFDALILVYAGALKGAGDTKWVMMLSIVLSLSLLAGPNAIIGALSHKFENPLHGLYLSWGFCTLFLVVLAVMSAWRFRTGHWKQIEMLEKDEPPMLDTIEEVPTGAVKV